jgi:tetratricopeptide (TPR) repeat protein
MPSLQEVEQFKSILNELGDEPEILAERDEEIEDIPPPDQGLPEGLSDLLTTPEGAAEPAVEGVAEEPGAPEQPGAPPAEAQMPFPAAPPEQEVDLSDLLGDQDLSGLDILEGLELPEGEVEATSTAEAETEAEAPPEASPEAPEIPAEFAEVPEPEAPEIPTEFAEAPVEAAEAPEVEEFPLEDFEFELPEEAAPEAPAEAPEPEAEPEAEAEPAAPEDEFAIPEGLFEPQAAEEAVEAEAAAPAALEEEFELPEEFAPPEEGFAEEEAGEAGEAAEKAAEGAPFEFELPEEEAPAAEEGISAEELPEMPGFDIEGFGAEGFAAPEGEEEAAAEEAFEIPEFEMPVEEAVVEGIEEPEEAAAEPATPQAPSTPEFPPPPEAPPEEQALGEAEFELPEEFTLPEEGFAEEAAEEAPAEEFAPEAEAPAGPSEEEAEFLKVLQEQILPEAEAPSEAPPQVPPEEPVEVSGEAPPEPFMEAPAAEAVPEEVSLEAEAAFPEGEHVDLEAPAEIPEGAEQYDLDEFSLEGLGEAFGVEEEVPAPAAPEEEIPAEVPVVEEQFPEEIAVPGAGEITFTDKQFAAIKRSLSRLPRNLKIIVEELIAEKGLEGEELRSLLALLIDGAALTAIAEQVSRLTGQRIVLPKVFERLTGVAFEERRRTFAYAFRENILPILRVVLLSLAVLGLLAFLGYRYVYRPLYANLLYRQGYSQIDKERYRMANDSFDKATSVWVFKNWFYRYAKGFTDKQQFQLASEKYEQLLRRFPRDRQGKIAYASLLTFHLAGYEKADKLLREVLAENMKDYDALLAQGDNYLEWAQEDESRYAEARFAYASIIDYYGEKDEVLMRMLRYFIRTDKFDETRTLKAYLDEKGHIRVDPELYASVYAELAGYWIDKGDYDAVPDMLFTAMDRKMNQPDVHYQLARYYRYVQDPIEEETALKAAITLLERMQPLDKKHLFMLIDSYNRRGETFWRREEYLDAEEYFQKAINRIEDAQSRRIFGQQEDFGLVYKNYGDLYYYISRDLEPALDLYLMALNNRYETPDLDYKIGYIHYAADRYEDALLAFSKVVDQRPSNENALYGLANSLYQRGYYSAAQGYYLRLLNLLEGREERIPYLQIYENPEHSALVQYIMKVYNNLGVTLEQLADRSLDPEKESKALVNLTFSSERFDLLSRDPLTVERGLTRNLAYLNQGGILYPTSDFELQIYTRLPIDLQAIRF